MVISTPGIRGPLPRDVKQLACGLLDIKSRDPTQPGPGGPLLRHLTLPLPHRPLRPVPKASEGMRQEQELSEKPDPTSFIHQDPGSVWSPRPRAEDTEATLPCPPAAHPGHSCHRSPPVTWSSGSFLVRVTKFLWFLWIS